LDDDEQRISGLGTCLRRLLPHLNPENSALTGSAAIDAHLASRNWSEPRRAADLDFVAGRIDAVSAGAARDFLVSHFHRPQPGYPKFLVQLVDPVSRFRIDIFPDMVGSLQRARPVDLGGMHVRVLDLGAILDHKLAILAGATEQRPVDEKHYRDAVLLGRICERHPPDVPAARLCREEYSRDMNAVCLRCSASFDAAFPLAPKPQIFEVLGYV
jgi:hypothetical protein